MTIIFMGLFIVAIIALQNYLYRRYWDKGLSVNIKFSAKEAFEGDKLYLSEELTNRKFLPLPWLFLSFRMSGNLVFLDENNPDMISSDNEATDIVNQNELFSIMMYQRLRRQVAFICNKRGIYRFERVNLAAYNLMYTKQFTKDVNATNQLVVFPKIIETPELEILYKKMDAELLSHQLINPDPFEFRGIREYQPTDPAHTVNFKATAVSQQLMVNIHAPISSKRLNILLNLEPYSTYPDYELYEHAIRLCASIAGHYIHDNVNVAFATNGRDIASREVISLRGGASTAHLYNIYEALARIDLTLSAAPFSINVDKIMDYEAVYLIISVYHQENLLDSFEGLRNRGGTAFMVIPVFDKADIKCKETEYVSVWEVEV